MKISALKQLAAKFRNWAHNSFRALSRSSIFKILLLQLIAPFLFKQAAIIYFPKMAMNWNLKKIYIYMLCYMLWYKHKRESEGPRLQNTISYTCQAPEMALWPISSEMSWSSLFTSHLFQEWKIAKQWGKIRGYDSCLPSHRRYSLIILFDNNNENPSPAAPSLELPRLAQLPSVNVSDLPRYKKVLTHNTTMLETTK